MATGQLNIKVVDLGLPSGRLWADRNIGAKSPEDFGLYFSWGNTDGHALGTDYEFNSEAYKKTPGAKLDGNIDAEHDAATVNLGAPWRMPTREDFVELVDNCTFECCSLNGYKGMKLTSKINGNSIFFACSGYGSGAGWLNVGSLGLYWSASIHSAAGARYLFFYNGGVYPQDNDDRFGGFAVRPVQ
jgi:hypothetical protein